MKTYPSPNSKFDIHNSSGIALVITLLMLSVITFLAVSFLVLTRSHRESVTATQDMVTAQDMSQAALARAQSQIIARMMAAGDLLNYDYMVSRNFINTSGFTNGSPSPYNVNYDFDSTGARMSPTNNNGANWAQNIANLFFDPRPPVFIKTNANPVFPADFRFWVDLNRNGRFETNGYLLAIQENGQPTPNGSGGFLTNYFNGEPEWIGVLQYPEYPHSATNRFIGRYAYIVLLIGKTLDFNFIHNFSKSAILNAVIPRPMPPAGSITSGEDGFARNQGVGSWELNLAALLWDLDINTYYTGTPNPNNYNYNASPLPNSGYAFDDAYSFLRFRYAANYGSPYPSSLPSFFGNYAPNYNQDLIDEYGADSIPGAIPPSALIAPWPGGYATNNFENIQDLFDPNKTSPGFTNRLLTAGSRTNSYDRYMFLRLLASIGTGSAPELQTWVYGDVITTNPALQPPALLRTKVNINYDNSYQIANGLNASPTNLIAWTQETNGALGFFTNAAESLLRSQNFRITNYDSNGLPLSQVYLHFGLTNIPVYNSLNPSIRYTEQLHRMLQLAANIYDATRITTTMPPGTIPYPSVFRPLFFATNYGGTNQALFIVGYASVTTDAATRISSMLYTNFPGSLKLPSDPTITTNDSVWGIPWVVGAVKGLPAFDRYVSDTSWMVTRKLLFTRQQVPVVIGTQTNILGDPTKPPIATNQFLIMSITNIVGLDAWNAYQSSITKPWEVMAMTLVTIALTNNSAFYPGGFVTNYLLATNSPAVNFWSGVGLANPERTTNGMLAFLQTNVASLPSAYFSESLAAQDRPPFVPVYANSNALFGYVGAFQAADYGKNNTAPLVPDFNWVLSVSNRVMYALVDPASGQAFDFVNLGPFGATYILTNLMYLQSLTNAIPVGNSGSTPFSAFWNPNPAGPGLPSVGVLNQISNAMFSDPYFRMEMQGTNANLVNSDLYFSCSNDTAATFPPRPPTLYTQTLLVNDPLVHYTVGDLSPPKADNSQLLSQNDRYEPWPYNSTDASEQTIGPNMTFKDPQITRSDLWNFPANRFPSVGWLGRVHRGTPWQTIFLKADPNPLSATGVGQNQQAWISDWVSTLDTYPTNDYALLDLFTAAPNDNAARGLLSVNQTNDAPWYALFSGLALNTNFPGLAIGNSMVLDPTNVAPLLNGTITYTTNGAGGTNLVFLPGITATRTNEFPDGLFHKLGSVFKSPMLTIDSPFLPGPASDFTDEQVEAIPQQVAGLLKLGLPQFVVYAYGQSLKPKDIYFGTSPGTFNLVTNYQITGEFLTRTVFHVVGDPAAASVKIQVDSYNILPAD